MAQLQFRCRCQNFLHASHRATRLLASSQGGGGACRPPLPPYRQNMGIGFGPNLIPSGKLACQPANDRGKREAKCGIVAWSPTKRHRKATLEAGGLAMAVLLQNYNIVAPLHASGAPVEHTNFISNTLQRNRETEKRRGEEKRRRVGPSFALGLSTF